MFNFSAVFPHVGPTVAVAIIAAAIVYAFKKLGFGKIIHDALLESDGSVSAARLFGFINLMAVVGWVTYVVVKTHAIPPLGDPATFLSAGNAPYLVNKVHDAYTSGK